MRNNTIYLSVFFLTASFLPVRLSAGEIWKVHNPSPPSSVALINLQVGGDGRMAALAQFNRGLLVSDDGVNWRWDRGPFPNTSLASVAWGNNLWVALTRGSSSAKTYLQTSSDLATWSGQEIVTGTYLQSVCYGGGKFWAVRGSDFNGGARTFTSTDGTAWSEVAGSDLAVGQVVDMVYDTVNNLLVAVGNDKLATSADGITWTTRVNPASFTFKDVHHANGVTIAVGSANKVYRSTDGTTWTLLTPPSGPSGGFISMTYGENLWLLLTSTYGLYKSTDNGATWSTAPNHGYTSPGVFSLGYRSQDGFFYGVGARGLVIATDTPSGTWTDRRQGPQENFAPYKIAEGNGKIVAVNANGMAFVSGDGLTWQQVNMGTASSSDQVLFANGKFNVIGGSTKLATSTDGVNWNVQTMNKAVSRMIWDGTQFVAIATVPSDAFCTSPDGITWTAVPGAVIPAINFGSSPVGRLHFLDGVYLIFDVSFTAAILHTSTDLINWQTSTVEGFYGSSEPNFAKAGGTWYACENNYTLKSTDARNWAVYNTTGNYYPARYPILPRGNRLYTLGDVNNASYGRMVYSDDGVAWQIFADTDIPSAGGDFGNGMIYTGTRLVLAGHFGMLLSLAVDLPVVSASPSFDTWKTSQGFTPGVNDGPADDPDKDGLSNFVEFAMGTDPLSSAVGQKPTNLTVNTGGQDYPAVRFTRRQNLAGITFTVVAATSVAFDVPLTVVESVVDLGGGLEEVTVRATTPLPAVTTFFFRVNLVQ